MSFLYDFQDRKQVLIKWYQSTNIMGATNQDTDDAGKRIEAVEEKLGLIQDQLQAMNTQVQNQGTDLVYMKHKMDELSSTMNKLLKLSAPSKSTNSSSSSPSASPFSFTVLPRFSQSIDTSFIPTLIHMEWNPQTLQFLSQCFLDTLSPQTEPRRRAEKNLSDAADNPNYGLAVLRLLAEPAVDEQIRQCAAVNFKNHLKTRWIPSSANPIPDAEKEQIKQLIVPLMLSSTPKIQAQLSEALAVIGKHDFPKLWPALLPELRSNLEKAINANDFASVNGILATVNSLFKKFRYEYKSDPILLDLKYCLDNFAAPLLSTVESISGKINAAAGSAPVLCQLIKAQRLCCRIYYSLNKMDLPEFFEDNADKWMNEFKNYLTVRYPIVEDSGDDGLALVDALRAAVCESISHYMEHEEELFQKYLSGFVEAVWSLLVVVSASPSRERLTVTAIKFLNMVSTSVHHALFSGDEIQQQISQSIVIPNVILRDEYEELFEMIYVEFLRRDMEGSDIDTRRRIACELLKGISGNYKQKITERVSAQINNCLALFAENPAANWKYKDCAIYLVVSLATKKAELQGQDVNAFPMLKADLKLPVQPELLLRVRKKTGGNQDELEVIIGWHTLTISKATWEDFTIVNLQFPEFHLEGKVEVWDAGNDKTRPMLVYQKRKKKGSNKQ